MFGRRSTAPSTLAHGKHGAGVRGVHVQLAELVALEHRHLMSAAAPYRPLHSLLGGRHGSRLRGRGLDFLEMRHYLPGDDVRTIDWRVTARTGRPHIRVHAEERDRPVVLVVDQRQNMFFATRCAMKSVVAAEAAALLGWSLRRGGDRVGALVFDDRDARFFSPQRGRAGWLRVLGEIARCNQALHAESAQPPLAAMLDQVLARLLQSLSPGHLIVLLSDFDGAGTPSDALIARLARHHELLALPVWDRGSQAWPERGQYVVSNGALQLALYAEDTAERERLAAVAATHRHRIERWRDELGVPMLPLVTDADVATQLQRALAVDPGMQVRAR